MLTTLLVNRLLVNIAYMKIWVHLTISESLAIFKNRLKHISSIFI